MSVIKLLPENLVNQIAAGEVIERPSSVVKELIENSLDSGADKIVIELRDAGKSLIKVSDNGKGIFKDDFEMAFSRHATSKISSENDLWKISTMGFRGEALASISSVSNVVLRSKVREEMNGYEIKVEGGNFSGISETGMADGTQIEVRDLFFNIPARQKYLKQDSTELTQITSLLNSIVLANPCVSFKLIHNGKVIFDLSKTSDLISRVNDLFGTATAEAMIPIFYGGSEFKIDGFIGKPVLARSSTQHQYFLVNKRPIQHFLLANTIKQAFATMLMENKKPIFIVNINIDPALIDVNVHPRKIEIRFEDQQSIIRILYSAVKKALESTSLMPKASESERYMSDNLPKNTKAFPMEKNIFENAMEFSKSFLKTRENQSLFASEKEENLKAVTQVSDSYIVAQDRSGLVLIDQHAAHERVRFEQLMDQFENEEKIKQSLLVPFDLELTHDEKNLLTENILIFENLGFEIEDFGGNTFVVNAVPGFLAKEDIESVVKGVLDDILNEIMTNKFQGKTSEIINYMACRSAIKFGKTLTLSEMQELINQMNSLKRPYTCPHGRPTMISLNLEELHRMFGRK